MTIKERPILFSAPMVQAILDGRKTQTRRIVKPQPSNGWKLICPGLCDQKPVLGEITSKHPKRGRFGVFTVKQHDGFTERDLIVCPYGQPGDRLWVRETWMPDPSCDDDAWDDAAISYQQWDGCGMPMQDYPDALKTASNVIHRASWDGQEMVGWKPSIHMPRWASRILLQIVSVRVERLNDISEDDAEAEGAPLELGQLEKLILGAHAKYRSGFVRLWESINGTGSWQTNPWVWVIEFKRIEP